MSKAEQSQSKASLPVRELLCAPKVLAGPRVARWAAGGSIPRYTDPVESSRFPQHLGRHAYPVGTSMSGPLAGNLGRGRYVLAVDLEYLIDPFINLG